LLIGVTLILASWATGITPAPELTLDNWKELFPIGLWTALAHAFSVVALGSGTVSFVQIVKAAEPVFAALNNVLLLGDIDHPFVYLSLLPIIFGVGLASLKEYSFNWLAFLTAAASNEAAALKNVASKKVMKEKWAKKLGPLNTFGVLMILALICSLPFVAIFDVRNFSSVYSQMISERKLDTAVTYSVLSGLAFYIYNVASFMVLEQLSPVSHSVANTIKRVIIIVISCLVFKVQMNFFGSVGSAVAVIVSFLSKARFLFISLVRRAL
jgi:solute carrier family 35 protein E1